MHIYSNTYVYMILYMYVYMCDRVRARALFFFPGNTDGRGWHRISQTWLRLINQQLSH